MTKEMRLNNLVIELDALSVVLLMTNNSANLLMEPLLTDCRNTCGGKYPINKLFVPTVKLINALMH